MDYLLDTNICIYLLTGRQPEFQQRILARLEALPSDAQVYLSSVVVFELSYGVRKSRWRKANDAVLSEFLLDFRIAPFDEPAALIAGGVRADLEQRGRPIGAMDTLIAAHALSLGAILVTHNQDEFSIVEGLKLEDWTVA
ncbi:MAG: type II toxin-antitoxin system VapC family toxin [Rhodocyclaceae bacterium]|nr:type II toxin-antitoxin system VapC family toxin [Rhodocyclaceae bacterium]